MNTYKRNPDIIWRVEVGDGEVLEKAVQDVDILDEGTVILAEDDMIHQLNFLGGKIWVMSDGKHSIDDMAEELLRIVDVDKEQLLGDITEFIENLTGRKWLLQEGSD